MNSLTLGTMGPRSSLKCSTELLQISGDSVTSKIRTETPNFQQKLCVMQHRYMFTNILIIFNHYLIWRGSQCPRGVKRWSAAARLLRMRVRIPLGARICVYCWVFCVVR